MDEPPTEAYHNKQIESSRKQSNNGDVMEMLAIMEQNMKERDAQLRAKLQIRDQYFDIVEIRRRDQFMDEAIR